MSEKNRVEYLPLGSVVILKGGVNKVVINSRGLLTVAVSPAAFFDYGGSLYPQGIVGDQIMYFNHEDIVKVVFQGYSDDDDKMMVDNINQWYLESEYKRISTSEFKNMRGDNSVK